MLGCLAGCLLVCVCARHLQPSSSKALGCKLCLLPRALCCSSPALENIPCTGAARLEVPQAQPLLLPLVAAKKGSGFVALTRSWAVLEGAKLPAKPSASAWLFVLEAFSNGNSPFLV